MYDQRFSKLTLILIMVMTCATSAISQNVENQKLTTFLSQLSEQHKVFFTYDADLLTTTYIDTSKINSEDLEDIIAYLRMQTKLNFDNLGNNYYVIYDNSKKGIASVEIAKKRLSETIATISDSNTNSESIIKGKVVNDFNQPISGVNITENGSLNGCYTDANGDFTLILSSLKTKPIP